MSFLLRNIARYAAQKLASNPRARETAAKAARRCMGGPIRAKLEAAYQ